MHLNLNYHSSVSTRESTTSTQPTNPHRTPNKHAHDTPLPPPQIAKLLIIPFVAVMEMIWFQKRFTPPVAASMVVVVIGVSIV
jgi:hypothetical protein